MTRRERRRALALLRAGRSVRCPSQADAAALAASAPAGALLHVVLLHGPACSAVACRCAPECLVEPLTGENYRVGQAAQARWARESVS